MGFFGGGASVDLASPPAIGNTTPNTGAFTTLSANNGTITTSSPAFTLAQTWNAGAQAFTALRVNATDTASAAGSLLMDLQVGGSSRLSVRKDSAIIFGGAANTNVDPALLFPTAYGTSVRIYSDINNGIGIASQGNTTFIGNSVKVEASTSVGFSWRAGASNVLSLLYDADNVLAQRRSTNAQTFRLYNTFTDASNYERGFLRWNTNVLEIGAEAAGTGTQRALVFKIGSTDVLTIATSATASFSSRVNANNFGVGANFIYSDTISNGFRFVDGSGSTNASGGLFLYNAYTNTTNNERGFVRWGSNRFQVGTISIGTGTARSAEITFYTSASDPTSSDITSGYFSVWKNSGTGTIKLWANDGGTMKSVALA